MYFAQYYGPSAINPDELIEGCGDRSVYILDGRNSLSVMHYDAIRWGRKHGWKAYHIEKGESLLRARRISERCIIPENN
jgi:hypothetical protein